MQPWRTPLWPHDSNHRASGKPGTVQIGDNEMHWGSLGPGPVSDTEWMALHDNPDHAMLVARSEPEPFPQEALLEIKQERLLGDDQDAEFPPTRIEIV